MKRKSIIAVLALVLVLALSLSIFSACNKKHKYSSEWKFDEKTHWHECTTKKHTDTTEKIPHVFTWTEKTPAGVHTDKVEKGVCECGYETERTIPDTATHAYGTEWKKDETGHWHDSTCDATAPTHDAMVGDFAAHTFDEGVETKPADFGVVGEKKFTCTVCGYEKTESIDALDAKDNEIVLVAGKTFGKEYDGEVVSITKGDFVIEGNREPAFMFKVKGADDNTYTATAPKNAGEYTVKVSVAATAEWKSATKTFDFAITPMVISVDWEHPYNNSNVISGAPAELIAGDEATIIVTMKYAYVGAAVQSFEITGKDAGNYSLAIEDVNVAIVKADIVNFKISNADAFKEFFVGATNIPDPTTNYVEIGDGYGDRDFKWQIHNGDGVWSPALPKSMVRENPGEWRVCIQYEDGINYNFGKTEYVYFTVKAKARRLTVKSFSGKTYDGKPVANFTFNNLVNKFSAPTHVGVENITSATESGEKYVEYRKKGDTLWTKVTDVAIPQNAAEYEYRIGVTATDEWEAVVSEVNTFTIKPYEFVLDLGYVENQHNSSSDGGKTFKLRTFSAKNGNELIECQVIELWLNNEKAGFNTSGSHFVPDQKKKVKTDCFFLKISNFVSANMENYKIVTKSPSVTTVEITVVESLTGEKSTTGKIQLSNETERWISATIEKGYFKVGQTVELYNSAGTKVGEAKITEIKAKGTVSASGCAIPSDGLVTITLDTGFSNMTNGKLVAK
ncbi:MAG: hypothetical protein L6V79_01935 [Clostridium sp.]|nr:MAG: hypothetical protein L6V79_01935 [Clostridium sp.]